MSFQKNDSIDSAENREENRNENNFQESLSYSMLEKDMQSEGLFSFMEGNSNQNVSEIGRLRMNNKQLKQDLQAEQDTVVQLRKRLNNAEKQKLESTTHMNSEIASLETQLTKLQSQVEKGEAARQELEFQLTKSQREVSHINRAAKEKEGLLMEGTDDLKQKIGDLSDEVKRLQKSLQSCQAASAEQETKLKQSLDSTSEKMVKAQAELESVRHEKDKLNELCQQHSNVISELNEKLQDFGGEKRNVLENLRRATAELEYAKEREDRMKADLESAFSRVKNLEENIEAERAAHLETKFNSEIVQLRVRDLDGAIEVEKSANTEANKAIERLTQQNRELEQVYEEERKTRKDLNMNFDKLEKEYMTVRRQLSSEVDDKKAVISNLSKELESHQKNFSELKTELTKAKKRQTYLEETYGGAIKELEFLLQTFHFDDKKLRISTRKEENPSKKVSNPSVVVENFKQMLIQLKKRLDVQIEEINKVKKTSDRLSKELESSREMIKAKDKMIEDTQKNYTKAAKDLNRARSNYAELESTIGKLKTSLQANESNQGKDRVRIQELSEEIMKLVKRHKSEEEEKIAFLHSLYQRMLSGHVIIPTKDKTFNQFAWADLTDMVYEQVSTLVDMLQTADEKLKASHELSRGRDDTIAALKQEHDEQLSRLTKLAQEREASWNQRKEEIEQHYTHLVTEAQTTSKKNQAMADQAWEKLRATGNVQQGLESEVVELRRELAESQVQTSCLLSACALLIGALYPLQSKATMLASERHILEEVYNTWESCRDRAVYLSSVLSSGKDSDQDKPERDIRFKRKVSPILRFRVGAIAVLAANRLAFLGRESSHCFVTYTSNARDPGLLVSVGGYPRVHQFKGVSSFNDNEDAMSKHQSPEHFLSSWLSSPELLEAIVGSMAELHDTLTHSSKEESPSGARSNVSAARSSFTKLMDRLSHFFPAKSVPVSMRERSSLLRKLEKHLKVLLSSTPQQFRGSLVSLQELMSNLQNHILDLTQRLHTAEKERRHLLADLNELKQQIGDESNSSQPVSDKVSSGKGTKYVAMSKFERVCLELSSALRREQKAQMLLQEQSSQLTELTSRLDACASEGMHKQTNLLEMQEGFAEIQTDLRHKEQSLRQVGKQLAQVEYERDSMQSNLRDAENALRTAVRDKEILAQYIRSVESALEQAKKQFLILREARPKSGEMTLSQLLLDADLIPQDIGKAGPELIAVQNMVGAFVDAQHQAMNKIKSLEEEISCHREHIDSLKQELSNAVHREFSEHVETMTDGAVTLSTHSEKKGNFVPLKEELDVSFDHSPPKSTTSLLISPQAKKSAFQSVKSASRDSPRGEK